VAAKFTEVVVLPTPPFWFAIAIILPINLRQILALKIQLIMRNENQFC
jgi:hypothetical protein